jgi:hypothetical protein
MSSSIEEQLCGEDVKKNIQKDIFLYTKAMEEYSETASKFSETQNQVKEILKTENFKRKLQELFDLASKTPIKKIFEYCDSSSAALLTFEKAVEAQEVTFNEGDTLVLKENVKVFVDIFQSLMIKIKTSLPLDLFKFILIVKKKVFDGTLETYSDVMNEISNFYKEKVLLDSLKPLEHLIQLFTCYFDNVEKNEDGELSFDEIIQLASSMEYFKGEKEKTIEKIMKESSILISTSNKILTKHEIFVLISKLDFNAISKILISIDQCISKDTISQYITSMKELISFSNETQTHLEKSLDSEKAKTISLIFQTFMKSCQFEMMDFKPILVDVESLVSFLKEPNFNEEFNELKQKTDSLSFMLNQMSSNFSVVKNSMETSVDRATTMFNESLSESFNALLENESENGELVDISDVKIKMKSFGGKLFEQDVASEFTIEDATMGFDLSIPTFTKDGLGSNLQQNIVNIGSKVLELLESDLFDEIQNDIAQLRINLHLYSDFIPKFIENPKKLNEIVSVEQYQINEILESISIEELFSFESKFKNCILEFEKKVKSGELLKLCEIDMSEIEMKESHISDPFILEGLRLFMEHSKGIHERILKEIPFEFLKLCFISKNYLKQESLKVFIEAVGQSSEFIQGTKDIIDNTMELIHSIDLYTSYYDHLAKEGGLSMEEMIDVASQMDIFQEEELGRMEIAERLMQDSFKLESLSRRIQSKHEILKLISQYDLNVVSKFIVSIRGCSEKLNVEKLKEIKASIQFGQTFMEDPKSTLEPVLGEERCLMFVNFFNKSPTFKEIFKSAQFSSFMDRLNELISIFSNSTLQTCVSEIKITKKNMKDQMSKILDLYSKIDLIVQKSVKRSKELFSTEEKYKLMSEKFPSNPSTELSELIKKFHSFDEKFLEQDGK